MSLDDDGGMGLEGIIRRRMRLSGESRAVAEENVRRTRAAMLEDAAPDDSWVDAWLTPIKTEPPDVLAQQREWLTKSSPGIQALARRFPPGCVVEVRAGVKMMIPAPGRRAIVRGYDGARGEVIVISHPRARFTAKCLADDLVLAGCRPEWSVEDVERALAASSPA